MAEEITGRLLGHISALDQRGNVDRGPKYSKASPDFPERLRPARSFRTVFGFSTHSLAPARSVRFWGEKQTTEDIRQQKKATAAARPVPLPPAIASRTAATSGEEHPAMYIRVKRNKTTYFIHCDPTETTLNIKQKLHTVIDQPPSNQRLSLLATNDLLDDSKTLANQKVENDAIVALMLKKDDNQFEDVFIARPEDSMSPS